MLPVTRKDPIRTIAPMFETQLLIEDRSTPKEDGRGLVR
jgi:hypothetical protein